MKNRIPNLPFVFGAFGLLATVIVSNLAGLAAASALPLQPAYRYTKIPDVQASSSTIITSVTTDTTGDSLLAGEFSGTINFAGSGGNDTITSSSGTAYVSKHNSDGSYDWTRDLDTSNNGYAQAVGVATDANGNVYMVGDFSGGVTFDGPGGSNSQSITGGGSFINKYSATGTYLWTKTLIPPPNGGASAAGIALDSAGNIYVAGNFQDTVNFAATDGGSDNQTAAGGHNDTFLTRFNSDGSYGWTKTFDSTNGDAGDNGVAIDPAGDIYLTGYFDGSVNFAGSSGSDTQADTSGNGSVYVAKFSTTGSYGWSRSFINNNSSYVGANSIAADPSGNVYVTGYLDGSTNFAGANGNDTQTDAGGGGDAFLTKFASSGSYGWTKTFDTSAGNDDAQGEAVTTDENGDIYLLSAFYGPVNFAGSSGSDTQNQNQDGAVTMYAPDGSYAWTRVFDTTNGSAVMTQGVDAGLAADNLGNLYIGSVFNGTVGFDGPGGGDIQTAGGYGSGFLTTYHTFIPNIATTTLITNPITTAATSNVVAASLTVPNTGYGAPVTSNYLVPATLVIAASMLFSLCYTHRLTKMV